MPTMLALTIGSFASDPAGCITCCCETVAIKPGETLPLRLDYAPWVLPIAPRGLHCAPSVEVEEKDTCAATSGNQPPAITAGEIRLAVPPDAPFSGDLKLHVTDPESDPLTFRPLILYGPKHGKLVLSANGTFTYTPTSGYTGPDNFFFSVSDDVNTPVVLEALLGVGIAPADVRGTWDLQVGTPIVDHRLHTVNLPLSASPAARPCQVFRLTIRQAALSCDWECYYHVDCVDVRIVKC
jgi:Bacterial Ig domain